MAIELIAKIKQKNNGTFFLVDAQDVEYNGKSLTVAIEGFETANGNLSELQTTVSGINGRLETAEQGISSLQTTVGEHTTKIGQIETKVAGKTSINDSDPSSSTTYSSTKIDTLVSDAKVAVKNEILGGAGAAYDTLQELAVLFEGNKDKIGQLESLAANHVSFTSEQSIASEQKALARKNIGAADEETVNTMNGTLTQVQEAANQTSADLTELKEKLGGFDTDYVATFEAALAA